MDVFGILFPYDMQLEVEKVLVVNLGNFLSGESVSLIWVRCFAWHGCVCPCCQGRCNPQWFANVPVCPSFSGRTVHREVPLQGSSAAAGRNLQYCIC